MSDDINNDRRQFLGMAVMAIAAARLGVAGPAKAQSSTLPTGVSPLKRKTSRTFGPLKQINAGLLNVGYVDHGPADGPAVLLLHGWPYDIHTYVDVAPLLTAAGVEV